MKTALNISIEPTLMMTIAGALKNAELGRLWRAVTACMSGEEDTMGQLLNNSGLRLAFALLQPAIDEAKQRLATNRANGARGGRPRKHAPADVEAENPVSTKKSKKEDLSPTPPIEEKNKKNKNITLSQREGAGDEERCNKNDTPAAPTVAVPELDVLQEQLLKEQPWLDELCMSRHISQADMAMYVMDFITYLRERDQHETLSRAKVHFVNQLP